MSHMPYTGPTPAAPATGRNYIYDVRDHGFVGDGVTNNTAALNTLWTTVVAAGGGTIYFPAITTAGGSWHFGLVSGSASLAVLNAGALRIRILGDGPASLLTWGGNAASADSHFIRLKDGASHVTVEKVRIVQKNLTNPEPAEQHFLFHLTTRTNRNVEHIKFIDCHFGVVKGDVINCTGGLTQLLCHGAFAANSAANLPGPFTSPANPQRVTVTYPASWDGGSVTVTGTDINDATITETIPSGTSDTFVGYKEFKTVVSGTHSAVGASSNTANIGYAFMVQHVDIDGCTFNGFEYAGSDPGYGYRACVVAQRLTRHIHIRNCWMTGSDDQLIDFEPTGNGDLSSWVIEDNTIIAASVAATQPPGLCVTLYGNGNSLAGNSLLLEDSSFSRNRVYGRVGGAKLRGCRINDNWIYGDSGTVAVESLLAFSDSMLDVDIIGNRIVAPSAAFLGKALTIEAGSGYAGKGLRINGNEIYYYANAGINVKDAVDLEISNNRLVYMAATTNTDDGIVVAAATATLNYTRITDNFIEGDRGGGTLRWAINYGPSASGNKSTVIIGNSGTGIATRGVSLAAGTYDSVPIVAGNSFPSATTPVLLGAGLVASASNGKWRGDYVGDATPVAAWTGARGERYTWVDGDNTVEFYKAVGTGNTGWQLREGPPVTVTSGTLSVRTRENRVSVTGTQSYTLPDGISDGQRVRLECTVAAATPIGTVTVTTPASGEPSTHICQTVGQWVELEWTGAAWHILDKGRKGSQTVVVGTTAVSACASTVNLSVTGTVSSALASGVVVGECVQVRCTVADGAPAGTLTGVYLSLAGVASTAAAFDATSDYFVAEWDGAAWLVLFSNGVVFS